jgi:hypothetical protein
MNRRGDGPADNLAERTSTGASHTGPRPVPLGVVVLLPPSGATKAPCVRDRATPNRSHALSKNAQRGVAQLSRGGSDRRRGTNPGKPERLHEGERQFLICSPGLEDHRVPGLVGGDDLLAPHAVKLPSVTSGRRFTGACHAGDPVGNDLWSGNSKLDALRDERR